MQISEKNQKCEPNELFFMNGIHIVGEDSVSIPGTAVHRVRPVLCDLPVKYGHIRQVVVA